MCLIVALIVGIALLLVTLVLYRRYANPGPLCGNCYRVLEPDDDACRYCGRPTAR